jgi:hypothetical protein
VLGSTVYHTNAETAAALGVLLSPDGEVRLTGDCAIAMQIVETASVVLKKTEIVTAAAHAAGQAAGRDARGRRGPVPRRWPGKRPVPRGSSADDAAIDAWTSVQGQAAMWVDGLAEIDAALGIQAMAMLNLVARVEVEIEAEDGTTARHDLAVTVLMQDTLVADTSSIHALMDASHIAGETVFQVSGGIRQSGEVIGEIVIGLEPAIRWRSASLLVSSLR